MSAPEPSIRKTLRRIDAPRIARALNFACFRNQKLLTSERACSWLAEALAPALAKHACDLWAYCVMPSHVHLLVFPRGDEPDIASFLESVKKSHARRALVYIKREAPSFLPRLRDEQPNGKVAFRFWQRGGGYDRNLWSPRAIWDMIDYIHRNPVEDGLCRRASEWRWSSAAWYERRLPGGEPGPIALNTEKLPPDPR